MTSLRCWSGERGEACPRFIESHLLQLPLVSLFPRTSMRICPTAIQSLRAMYILPTLRCWDFPELSCCSRHSILIMEQQNSSWWFQNSNTPSLKQAVTFITTRHICIYVRSSNLLFSYLRCSLLQCVLCILPTSNYLTQSILTITCEENRRIFIAHFSSMLVSEW